MYALDLAQMRSLCLAVLAFILLTPLARAQQEDSIAGWWRADIRVGDETEPFFAHFDRDDTGAPRFRFSVPVGRMHEVEGGAYEARDGGVVRLVNFDLTLQRSADGGAIDGVFPPGFVSGEPAQIHFVRSEAPSPPAPIPTQSGAPPAPVWTASVGAEVWGGLALDGNRALFVADALGRVTAFSPRTGVQLWQSDLGSPIRARPTLVGRRLFVASDAAAVALDARSGRQLWSTPFGAEKSPRLPITDADSKWDHYSSAVAVDGDFAAVGSRDGCFYALNARTGAQRWRSCTEALITSTPAISRDAVYFGGYDHNAYALARRDGRELWRYDAREVIPRDVAMIGDNVLFGSRIYSLIALNARTGAPSWTRHVWYSWIDAPPTVADGRIYTGTSDAAAVFAFDQNTGARVWAAPVPGWTWGGVALGRDTLYTGIVGATYSTPRAGGFAAFARADGAPRWTLPAEPGAEGEIYGFAAAPAVSETRVFAADLNGQVYAFGDN